MSIHGELIIPLSTWKQFFKHIVQTCDNHLCNLHQFGDMNPRLKSTEYHVVVTTTLSVTQSPGLSLDVNITVDQWNPCRPCRHEFDQSGNSVFVFYLNNHQILIEVKYTPGCVFLFFSFSTVTIGTHFRVRLSQQKGAWLSCRVLTQHKLRAHHIYTHFVVLGGILFFPMFFFIFISLTFLHVFTCTCCRLFCSQDALVFLFACDSQTQLLSSHLFPLCFLTCYNFFTGLKNVFCSYRFVITLLTVLFQSCCRVFFPFLFCLFCYLRLQISWLCIIYFVVLWILFLLSFCAWWWCWFISWCPSVINHTCSTMYPLTVCDRSCSVSPTFLSPSFHTTHVNTPNTCVHTCTLFTRSHVFIHGIMFIHVLCVCC